MNDPGPWSRSNLTSSQPAAGYPIDDDPFVSPSQMDMFRASTATSDYVSEPFVNHPRAGASTRSLISSRRESSTYTFDDSAHLTANMPLEPPDGAIGERTLNTVLRLPHDRGVVPFAIVRTCPHSLALGRSSPRAFIVSRDDGDKQVGESDDDGVEKMGAPVMDSSFLYAGVHWNCLGRPIASGSRCTIF
ncbi:hypothetical protein EI94DRAFT_1739869 [Lactarius quietus]|nr:hypothetical protein EI94DRAFT_1739869 [Lactarius quietus]